jgi:hypothetical protein
VSRRASNFDFSGDSNGTAAGPAGGGRAKASEKGRYVRHGTPCDVGNWSKQRF